MNKYEMYYIIDNAVSDEDKDAVIAKFEDIIKKSGGAVEKSEKVGAKKLAYPINYKEEGYYVLLTFESDPSLIVELNRVAGIDDRILRRMVVKL